MIIQWELTKKRGNFRPEVQYTLTLEPFEQELGIEQIHVTTALPKPPESWQGYCYPGCLERRDLAANFSQESYVITTPSHKTVTTCGSVRLPWKEGSDYSEVREAFELVRTTFEAAVKAAFDSAPLEVAEELSMSLELKQHISSGVAAKKLLQVAGF